MIRNFVSLTSLLVCVLIFVGCQPIEILAGNTPAKDRKGAIPVYQFEMYRVETTKKMKVGTEEKPVKTIEFVHLPAKDVAYYIKPTTTMGPNSFSVERGEGGYITKYSGGGDSGASALITAVAGSLVPISTTSGSDNTKEAFSPENDFILVYKWNRATTSWEKVDSNDWLTPAP